MVDEDLRILAHKLCCDFLSGRWNSVSPSDIKIEPVSGGLSNVLYCCSLPSTLNIKQSHPNQILLRFYGQSVDNDATTGSVIFMLLSERKLGPKLYGVFSGGRLEEFLSARPLTQIEMKTSDISSAIARKIADIHSLEVPIGKRPSWLFDRCIEWADYISENADLEKTLVNVQDKSRQAIVKDIFKVNFYDEIQWLREIVARSNSPAVFSHNDLLRGNILIHEESEKFRTLYQRLVLIDFEYCSYNYRGFDIACHFCEWCFDYTRPGAEPFGDVSHFPDEQQQRKFVHEYLDQARLLSNQNISSYPTGDSGMASPCNLSTNSSNDKSIITAPDDSTCTSNLNDTDCKSLKTQPIDSAKKPSIQDSFSLSQSNSMWNKSKCDSINCSNSDDQPSKQCTFPETSTFKKFNSCITKQDEDLLMEEIQPFIQCAHLLWTLWSIKNAYCSEIQFDYWKMASEKLKFYIDAKRVYKCKGGN